MAIFTLLGKKLTTWWAWKRRCIQQDIGIVICCTLGILLMFLPVDLLAGDPRRDVRCMLVRKGEILDNSESLPRTVRLANHSGTPVAVPATISSSCFDFYRPDGTQVIARERLGSVDIAPRAASDYDIIKNGKEGLEVSVDSDCRVRRIDGGVLVESTLYEWRLASGEYMIVVKCEIPETVMVNGRPVKSESAFGGDVRCVNITSSPILVRVP